MRRLLAFAGLATAGAFLARKLRGRDTPTPQPEQASEPPVPLHPVDREFAGDTAQAPRDRVAEEEAAAAAEAGAIGGPAPRGAGDPAMDPVYQAGGGEAEGFEAAEAELIENASHGEGRGKPWRDAFSVERESDLSGASYGEPDEVDVTEVVRDADAARDPSAGAGEGPGRAHDR